MAKTLKDAFEEKHKRPMTDIELFAMIQNGKSPSLEHLGKTRIFLCVVVGTAAFAALYFVLESIGISVLNEDDKYGFHFNNLIMASTICYLLEGFISVKILRIETREYQPRRHKNECAIIALWYLFSLVAYKIFDLLESKGHFAYLFSTLPLILYLLWIFLRGVDKNTKEITKMEGLFTKKEVKELKGEH